MGRKARICWLRGRNRNATGKCGNRAGRFFQPARSGSAGFLHQTSKFPRKVTPGGCCIVRMFRGRSETPSTGILIETLCWDTNAVGG